MLVSRNQFDVMVDEAWVEVLRRLAPELSTLAAGVVVHTALAARPEQDPEGTPGESDLLGLYEGVPLVERGADGDVGMLPDRITLFYRPLVEMCADRDELREEIWITLVHELGHFFGLDEDELWERGFG
ncbi:MAG: metallopeptidase family protein [Anaerolineales bacterium]|nr:metallopeptidase family protein [Anaerolineales bacterium]